MNKEYMPGDIVLFLVKTKAQIGQIINKDQIYIYHFNSGASTFDIKDVKILAHWEQKKGEPVNLFEFI